MKYAVSVKEQGENPEVDMRFGRAQTFALFDSQKGSCVWYENGQNYSAVQGAGIQTAQNVVNMGAEAVISGHCGPKAYRVLVAAGIKVFAVEGKVTLKEAIELVESGKVKALEGADVDGHWV